MSSTLARDLKPRTKGLKVLFPGTSEYRRSAWTGNRLYWGEKPVFVAKATTSLHVEAAIILAQQLNVSLTIKNGGHSYAGFSNSNGGILLDLSEMRYAEMKILSRENATMTIGGGALWGDAYKLLADNDTGFIINGGRCPSVGASGFTQGGGLTPFTRYYGMTIDRLKEVTIVTARGGVETVTASESQNSDLFWALRGGGGGNFGVVVQMTFQLDKLEGFVVTGGSHKRAP